MAPSISLCTFALFFLFSPVFSKTGEVYHLLKFEDGSHRLLRVDPVDVSAENLFKQHQYDAEASALYRRLTNETGWSFIEIHSNASKSNEAQAYAAGFIEGSVTADLIYMHWFNTLGDFCEGDGRAAFCQRLQHFIEQNTVWVMSKVALLAETDEYWHQVKLFYVQIQGMADGYKSANKDPKRSLTFKDLLWLNLQGDFEDLTEVLKAQEKNFYKNEEYLPTIARGLGHCSALIKILPDGSELFVAQDTWSSYQSMLRLQKKYVLSFKKVPQKKKLVPGIGMSLSSYPGVITSGDDFYLISSGLATLETTIGNGNASLWQYVQPNGQVFEGIRSLLANRLALDGRTWAKLFAKFNSGTYNNQWMIVDYNKFIPNRGKSPKDLPAGVLWVVEQIPRYIQAKDMTDVLRKTTYWPSYNVAAFPEIFNISGNQAMVTKFGDWFTYDKNPRALIFKRDHGKVHDLKTMYELMRYNDFKHDPLSRCNCNPPFSAENAISARCDLNPINGAYPFPALGHRQHGATDAKITASVLYEDGLRFLSVSGPVFNESLGLPPFQWTTSDFGPTSSHLGHPDLWTFEPQLYEWV